MSRRIFSLPIFAFLACLCFASIAHAIETEFVEIAPETQIRLIVDESTIGQKKILAGIDLRMPKSTRTYWRIPGETGIPMMIENHEGSQIASIKTHWPLPQIIVDNGYTDFVYFGDTVFPLDIELQGGATGFDFEIMMGICDEICVPARAKFSVDWAKASHGGPHKLRIRNAMNRVPIDWPDASSSQLKFEISLQDRSMRISGKKTQSIAQNLIISSKAVGALFGQAQQQDDGDLIVPILSWGKLDGQPSADLQVLFDSNEGPYFFLVNAPILTH